MCETAIPISMKYCVSDLFNKFSRSFNVDSPSGVITSTLHTAAIEYWVIRLHSGKYSYCDVLGCCTVKCGR
jgi:hypothetical protein